MAENKIFGLSPVDRVIQENQPQSPASRGITLEPEPTLRKPKPELPNDPKLLQLELDKLEPGRYQVELPEAPQSQNADMTAENAEFSALSRQLQEEDRRLNPQNYQDEDIERTWLEAGHDTALAGVQGIAQLIGGVAWLGNKAGIGDGATAKDMVGFAEDINTQKSAAAQQAAGRIEEAKGFTDTAKALWDNPIAILDIAAQSAPMAIPGMGTGALAASAAAKITAKKILKAGVSEEVAKTAIRAAATSGAIAGGRAGESVTSGLMAGNQAEQGVLQTPVEQLRQTSSRFNMLEDKLGNAEAARQALAGEAGVTTAFLTGGATAAGGYVAGYVNRGLKFGDTYADTLVNEITAKAIPRNVAGEIVEEVAQSPAEQFAGNVATKALVNDEQSLGEGVDKAAALGAAGALGQSGVTQGIGYAKGKMEMPQPGQPQPQDDTAQTFTDIEANNEGLPTADEFEAQQAAAQQPATPPPAAPAQPASGPLTKAAQSIERVEPDITDIQMVSVTLPTGETQTGFVDDFQQGADGSFRLRMLDDNDNVYEYTSEDGVQVQMIEPEISTPEPAADIVAQVGDMLDPRTNKKAVYIAPSTAQSLQQRAGEIKAVIEQSGAQVYSMPDPQGGVLISTDPQLVNDYQQSGFTDDARAAALGVNPKSAIRDMNTAVVVERRNEDDKVVNQQVVDQAVADQVAQQEFAQAPQGQTVQIKSAEDMQADRLARLEEEAAQPMTVDYAKMSAQELKDRQSAIFNMYQPGERTAEVQNELAAIKKALNAIYDAKKKQSQTATQAEQAAAPQEQAADAVVPESKREKAIARVNAGEAWFGSQAKADQWISKQGLTGEYSAAPDPANPKRFIVQPVTAELPQLVDEQGRAVGIQHKDRRDFSEKHGNTAASVLIAAQMNGEQVTLNEVISRAKERDAQRQLDREQALSPEAKAESDKKEQEKGAEKQAGRDSYIAENGGVPEDGRYSDDDGNFEYEIRNGIVFEADEDGQFAKPYGDTRKGSSDDAGVGIVSFIAHGTEAETPAGEKITVKIKKVGGISTNKQDRRAQPQPEGEPRQRRMSERDAIEKDLAKMTFDEMVEALEILRGVATTHELTGLPNKKSWYLRNRKEHEVSIDVDSLKWVNDNMGHEVGDELLKLVAKALEGANVPAFHVSGDEFYATGDDKQALIQALDRARESLADVVLTSDKYEMKGAGFSYGIAGNIKQADEVMTNEKSKRESEGKRAARGERPSGVTQTGGGDDQAGSKSRPAEDAGAGDARSAQYQSYAKWINDNSEIGQGLVEQIKADERLEDGEAEALLDLILTSDVRIGYVPESEQYEEGYGIDSEPAPKAKQKTEDAVDVSGKSRGEVFDLLTSGQKIRREGETKWIEETKVGKVYTYVVKTKSDDAPGVTSTKGPVGPDRQWGWAKSDAAEKAIESWSFAQLNEPDSYGKKVGDVLFDENGTDYLLDGIAADGKNFVLIKNRDKLSEQTVNMSAERFARLVMADNQFLKDSARASNKKTTVPPIADDRKLQKLSDTKKAGKQAYLAGEATDYPEWMADEDLRNAWDEGVSEGRVERAKTEEKVEPAKGEKSLAAQLSSLDVDDLNSLIDDVVAETHAPQTSRPARTRSNKPKTGSSKPRATKSGAEKVAADEITAAEAAKSLGVNLSKAGMDGLKGLSELFGGKNKLSSGLTFDEETYQKAKPHFIAMLKDFQAAGKDLRDFIRAIVGHFGDGAKPYIVNFAADLRDNPDMLANADQPEVQDVNITEEAQGDSGAEAEGGKSAGVQTDEAGGGAGDLFGGTDDGVRGKRRGGRSGGAKSTRAPAGSGQGSGSEQPVSGGGRVGAKSGGRTNKRNFRIKPDSLKREGSWKTTAEQNVRIVELVKQIMAEGREATPEEKELLTKFTGWGASEIANGIFPNQYGNYKDSSWEQLGERLKAVLTEEEYAQAKRTTQYAHYTSEPIIRSVYSAIGRMGFNGGEILEPGMGIGLFNGIMPEDMAANSHYTGIEYDTITGNIAKLLYPDSNIIVGDFTKTNLPKSFFDAAIGNPPFGSIKIQNDPEYRKQGFMLHDYFFAKTIDRVKPGGILVFVTSKGTMDKATDRARKYLAERADLVGAVRLPQTAFKDNAGTEVVTDVIFLRKRRDGEEPAGEAWQSLAEVQTAQGPAMVNEYFAANPQMVLGRHAKTGSMYRADEYTVEPVEGDIEELFAKAIENLPENIYRPDRGSRAEKAAVIQRDYNPKIKKEGGIYVDDNGTLMQVESGQGVPLTSRNNTAGKTFDLKPKEIEWLKGYVKVRDALKQAQYDQINDGDWEKSLAALNKAYDGFVKKHGDILAHTITEREGKDGETIISRRFKNASLIYLDAEGALAYALEEIGSDGVIRKSPVLNGRTLNKPASAQITNTRDAMFVSLNDIGRFDIEDVARLAGKTEDEVIAELGDEIYEDPAKGWTTADDYLSGNVVRKLKEAETAARISKKYQRNIEALKNVQPKALAPADIGVQLGAAWVPASDIANFAAEALEEKFKVTYSQVTNQWTVDGRSNVASKWGMPEKPAEDILEGILNNRQLKITYRDADGKSHVDAEGTEKVNDIAKKMRAEFRRWIWTDANRSERLARFYNENYNNIAPRIFDGSHLTLPGVSARFVLRPHQKRAIWRTIQEGDTYYAHAVGAGKTFTMIAAGMEERRLGLVKKPMYVVPNHMLAQFSKEFLELYPTASIMVADEQNFHTHNRRKFVAQAALNDPDAIVITHSAFGRIGMSEEFSTSFIQKNIEEWTEVLKEIDRSDRITRKQIERRIEQLENRMAAIIGGDKKDVVLTFEELGVDRLYIDEGHEFRKLDFPTNRSSIKGIDSFGSQKSMDLFMKVQYLRAKNPKRSLVMASGTPVTNSMGELFTVQRFFQPQQLEEDGDNSFDAWASHYGEVVEGLEQNAAGGYETVSRFAKFTNVPELMSRVRSFMDILTSSSLGDLVQRPDVKGGGRKVIVTPVPDGYKAYQKQLEDRIKAIRNRKGPPAPGDDIILKVISDGRFSAIDMRFVDPTLPSDPNSKLNVTIDDMLRVYHETADYEYHTNNKKDPERGASLMLFTDIGLGEQSARSRGFDMKAWIEKRLIEGGVKPSHIAFMRDNKAHAKKEKLFNDLRQGNKRILIGGKDMETGVNAQKRLVYLGHLDAPWFPASVEQREGRAIRQGNQNSEVELSAYATKGSYDSTMWGMNSRKARFIEQAFNGDNSVRSMEDVSEASAFEMAAALASGDERYLKMAGLKGDVDRLNRLYSAHLDEQRSLRGEKAHQESFVARRKKELAEIDAAIAKSEPIKPGEFKGTIGKTDYDSREDFSNKLFSTFKGLAEANTEGEQELGRIGGLSIMYNGNVMQGSKEFLADVSVDLPGDPEPLAVYPIDPAMSVSGIATRAANQVNSLPRQKQQTEERVSDALEIIRKLDRRIGASFPEQSELAEKTEELAAIEAELAAEGSESSPDAAVATLEVEGESGAIQPAGDNKYSLWRSSLTDAIRAEKGKRPPEQWKAWANSRIKDGKFKKAEVEAVGLMEWLDLQSGQVQAADVLAFVEANGVQVKDVELGDARLFTEKDLPEGWTTFQGENGLWYVLDADEDEVGEGGSESEAIESAMDVDELADSPEFAGKTKYSSYRVPGGKNYRELLLTLPASQKNSHADFYKKMLAKYGSAYFANMNMSEMVEYERTRKESYIDQPDGGVLERNAYKSSHWDQPNILAHVRFDERTDAEGSKVLFVQELQSDWGQEGKKKGFASPKNATIDDAKDFFGIENSVWSKLSPEEKQSYFDEMQSGEKHVRGGIPRAPFVTKTDAWVSLAIKRMIAYAADNGFDKVAFISGEQAADLYDLSKQVDSLIWTYDPSGYAFTADKNGQEVINKTGLSASELESFIGKETAEKILKAKESGKTDGKLSGIDLKVGGSGMRSFYDRIVPSVVKDVVKKLGGDDITETTFFSEIETRGEDFDAKAFVITDKMREIVAGGIPLFSKAKKKGASSRQDIVSELRDGVIGKVAGKLIDSGKVVVHQSVSELPGKGHPSTTKGMTAPDGTLHLVADNMVAGQATGTLLHEAFHRGAESFLGSKAWARLSAQLDALMRQYEQSSGKANQFYQAALEDVASAKEKGGIKDGMESEEFAAYAIENYEQAPSTLKKWVDDLVGYVKAFFLKTFGMQMGALTPAQLRAIAVMAIRSQPVDDGTAAYSVNNFLERASKVLQRKLDFVVSQMMAEEISAYDTGADDTQESLLETYFQNSDEDKVATAEADALDLTQSELADKYLGDIGDALRSEGVTTDARTFARVYMGMTGRLEAFLDRVAAMKSPVAFQAKKMMADMASGRYSVADEDNRYSLTREQQESLDTSPKVSDAQIEKSTTRLRSSKISPDINAIEDVVLFPRGIASTYKEYVPVWLTNVSQFETTNKNIAEMQSHFNAYHDLPAKSKARVNKVLELGRMLSQNFGEEHLLRGITNTGYKTIIGTTDAGRRFKTKSRIFTELSKKGDVIQLNDKEVGAYMELRSMFDNALSKFRNQLLADFGLEDLITSLDPLTEIRDRIADQMTPAKEKERLSAIYETIAEIEQAKRQGYVPLSRYGDIYVAVTENDAPGIEYVKNTNDGGWIVREVPEKYVPFIESMGATFNDLEGGWQLDNAQKKALKKETDRLVYYTRVELTPKQRFSLNRAGKKGEKLENFAPVRKRIDEINAEWGGENREISAGQVVAKEPDGTVRLSDIDSLADLVSLEPELYEQVREKLADAIQSRSFRKHFFRSDNVPGYSADFDRNISDYILSMSGYLSRRQHASRWDAAIKGIKTKNLAANAQALRDYVNKPQEELQLLRTLGFLNFLAGNISSALLNLGQFMFSVGYMLQVARPDQVAAELTRALADVTKMMRVKGEADFMSYSPDAAPADVRDDLKDAWDRGLFVPLVKYELFNAASTKNTAMRPVAKAFGKTIEGLASPFTFFERLPRLATYIAMHRLARKANVRRNSEQVMKNNPLFQKLVGRDYSPANFAHFAVDETQSVGGKINRAKMFRNLGAIILQFKNWVAQMIGTLYRWATQNGVRGIGGTAFVTLLTLPLVAGMFGAPGAEDMREAVEYVHEKVTHKDLDIKTEVGKWMYEMTGSPEAAEAVIYGLPFALGVDMRRMGMGEIVPDKISDLAPAINGMWKRFETGADQIGMDNKVVGAASFLPLFGANPMTAWSWSKDGVYDTKGNKVLDTSDLSVSDIVQKSLGVQPTIVTKTRDARYAVARGQAAADSLKRNLERKYIFAWSELKKAKGAAAEAEAKQKLDDAKQEIRTFNAENKGVAVIKITPQRRNQLKDKYLVGPESRYGKERKVFRKEAENIRAMYGISGNEEGDE